MEPYRCRRRRRRRRSSWARPSPRPAGLLARRDRLIGKSDQMSRNRTSPALVVMKCLRNSTSSPIRMLHTSSAMAACSMSTRSRVRAGRVHGGLAQLVPVHLAEALQPVELVLVVRMLGEEPRSAASSLR